ncbi:MAG: carbohydrate kinase family protein [Ferroplasma sp.]
MNNFLAFFGHLNIDVKISVPKLPSHGEAMGVKNVEQFFAGTAGNFAFIAASLGLKFDLYSAVGYATHAEYIKLLDSRGIGTGFVKIDKDMMGPVCYLPSDGKEQISYMFQGPMDIWKPASNFKNNYYDYVNLGTGPVNEYIKIVKNNKTSKIVFDPGQEIWYTHTRETLREIIPNSYLLIMNNKEFTHMLELSEFTLEEILNKTKFVIITGGENGTDIYSKGDKEHVSSLKARKVYDTVGAGDAFRAGLYTAIFKGYGIKDSVLIGNAVASIAIQDKLLNFNKNFDDVLSIVMKLKMQG